MEPANTRKTAAKPWEIEDGLWARIEPLLPVVVRNRRRPGRKRLDSRKVLCGILFVLYTGIRWDFLPQELGYGSGMTCWRRLRDWTEAGVWQRLHELLLAELRGAGLLDFSRAAVDSSHLRAMKGGPATGPSPVDRAKTGSKHHLIDGSSRVRSHCCTGSAACASAGRSATTSTRPSSPSAAPLSAGEDSVLARKVGRQA